MSETESPETQIRGRMRDASQTVLYRMYSLMDEHFGKGKLEHKNAQTIAMF